MPTVDYARDYTKSLERYRIEKDEDWRGAMDKIPAIIFPTGWGVTIIPPFGGAIARFLVKLPDGRRKSIYLDFYDRLGIYGQPYWEVHPYRGDCGRCDMADVQELLEMIAGESE